MARIIHRFKYRNKFFRAGELTVGDYMLSKKDPEYFIEKILTEFNDTVPNLTQKEMDAFLDILFNRDDLDTLRPKPNKTATDEQDDFHILLASFMKITNQGYLDTMAMPLELFNKMLDDLEIIAGQKEYDKDRNKKTPDKKKLKEIFGDAKAIKS